MVETEKHYVEISILKTGNMQLIVLTLEIAEAIASKAVNSNEKY